MTTLLADITIEVLVFKATVDLVMLTVELGTTSGVEYTGLLVDTP
jgi:hypothetical protein